MLLIVLMLTSLVSCGSSDGVHDKSDILITGKAVAGLPVVGTINIKDSSSPVKTSFSAIESDGSYSLNIDNSWTPPFMLWTEGWVNDQQLMLLSCFDLEEGETEANVNTTPITTSIVASAMGKTVTEIVPESDSIPDLTIVDQIRVTVEETLANLFDVLDILPGFNLFESPFEVGDPEDLLFDTIGVSSDDQGNIIFTDLTGEEFVIDPDQPSETVPQEIVDNVLATGDTLTQISDILSDYYGLFDDPVNPPDLSTLNTELAPDLAVGFLNRGEGSSDWIDRLASSGAPSSATADFIGCSIYRPMQTQYYGNIPVYEVPDTHEEGLWVLVTTNTNGKTMSWYTSFVNIGGDTWKWYGNRRPFRSAEIGRPRARQINYPANSVVYLSGLSFWHNDVGNLALDMGITNLAIFNPAFAPENIDGVETNCVRLEKRAGGTDTRYRLKEVSTWWDDDHVYQLSKKDGDRLIDLDILKSQAPIEMVFFGLDDEGIPVRTWMNAIPEAPHPVSDFEADPDKFFAQIEQDSISFQAYDASDPDNPDAFPGNGGLFSWILPDNSELFPSWAGFGWNDASWNWNENSIDNPAWFASGDFSAWTSEIFQPGPTAVSPRMGQFWVALRDTNQRHYQVYKRWDPWSEDMISVENNALVFDVSHSWSEQNLDPSWGRLTARTRIKERDVTRIEVPIVVESASTTGNAYVETEIKFTYQPPENYGDGDTNYLGVYARIRYQNEQLSLQGFIWGSLDADGSETFAMDPVGDYPLGQELNLNQTYTLAIEYLPGSNEIMIEFDDGSLNAPYQGLFDMDDLPQDFVVFDANNFRDSEIRTRVRSLQEEGDTGNMRVSIDNVKVDDVIFDEFTGGFANNKWDILTYE